MSQAQEAPIPSTTSAGPVVNTGAIEDANAQPEANKTKRKAKTLKKVLPSGPGFQVYRDADGKEIKVLEDEDEAIAFKRALRAASPNLEKAEVDAAVASLFHKAAEMAPDRAASDESISNLLLAAARQVGWVVAARESMKPAVAVKVMMRFYEARRIAIKFSAYRQHPIRYDEETATAKAIDAFCDEKPNERPEEPFTDWAEDMLDHLMSRILCREDTSWDEKEDEDADASAIGSQEAAEFAATQKAVRAEVGKALVQKLKEMGMGEDVTMFIC